MKEKQLLLILIVTITVVHAFGKKNKMDSPFHNTPVKPSQPVIIVNPGNNKTVPAININQLEKENQIKKMHQPSFYRYHHLKNRVDTNIAVLASNEVINHFERIRASHA